jgi:hypothetical protein
MFDYFDDGVRLTFHSACQVIGVASDAIVKSVGALIKSRLLCGANSV